MVVRLLNCSHADGEREEAGDILSVIVTELPGQFRSCACGERKEPEGATFFFSVSLVHS